MPPSMTAPVESLTPTQAAELAVLVELEARWENLRTDVSRTAEVRSTLQDLQGVQRAYEAFRLRLSAYNKRYAARHVPEAILNTPARLGTWCRRMHDLFARLRNDPHTPCPVHLVEKACRCAERIAARLGRTAPAPAAPSELSGAIAGLAALSAWCENLSDLPQTLAS